mgnify:FL=1
MERCYYLPNLQSTWQMLSTDGFLLKPKPSYIMIGINAIQNYQIMALNVGMIGFWENLKKESGQ